MITLTNAEKMSLTDELKSALIYFSDGDIDNNSAMQIATHTLDSLDIKNPALSHIGMNWLAKEVLKKIN
ncbi:hypothetical protein V6B14_23105 (plasmid) [Sporosarcina psychrophila]|uniref:hypothetical protein n=1 Tax=Sporosarcina psychrophila TaxID=1476 RepID=UPI0030D130CF